MRRSFFHAWDGDVVGLLKTFYINRDAEQLAQMLERYKPLMKADIPDDNCHIRDIVSFQISVGYVALPATGFETVLRPILDIVRAFRLEAWVNGGKLNIAAYYFFDSEDDAVLYKMSTSCEGL